MRRHYSDYPTGRAWLRDVWVREKCRACADGACPACGGIQLKRESDTDGVPHWRVCAACGGSGYCATCDGFVWLVWPMAVLPDRIVRSVRSVRPSYYLDCCVLPVLTHRARLDG